MPAAATGRVLSPAEARTLILAGGVPGPLVVNGPLDLAGTPVRRLPDGLSCTVLDLRGCHALEALPRGLVCDELVAADLRVEEVPPLHVRFRLTLDGNPRLARLPENLRVGALSVRDCPALPALPEGLDVNFLDVSGCVGLRAFPARGRVRFGHLRARGCVNLAALPAWLGVVAGLDVAGCSDLTSLPAGLRVGAWLDLADCGLVGGGEAALPANFTGALRWRGVRVEPRVVYAPETITAAEVLATENVELRRVKMERMGYERFLADVDARVLDADRDPGGERRLLRVPLPGDEDLVALAVICPSTGRRYVLRVPPATRTCRQAAAWIAGFDDAGAYSPLAET